MLRSIAVTAMLSSAIALPGNAQSDPFDSAYIGLSLHDAGSNGENGLDGNFELRFDPLFGKSWAIDILPTIGGSISFGDGANTGYLGATARYMLTDSFFVEGFFGLTLHDADTPRDSNEADLGCALLFREGVGLGYLRGAHALSLYASHVSHGNILCDEDENNGLTSIGVRYGYHF